MVNKLSDKVNKLVKELLALKTNRSDDFRPSIIPDLKNRYFNKEITLKELEEELEEELVDWKKLITKEIKEGISTSKEELNRLRGELSFLKRALKSTGKRHEQLFKQFKLMDELRYWFLYPDNPWENTFFTRLFSMNFKPSYESRAPQGHINLVLEAIPHIKHLIKLINLEYLRRYDYLIYYWTKIFINDSLFSTRFGKYDFSKGYDAKSVSSNVFSSVTIPSRVKKVKLSIEDEIKEKIKELEEGIHRYEERLNKYYH